MRPTHRLTRKQGISLYAHTIDLPLEEKLAYGAALVSAIATLLPWFSFGVDNRYNGLQNVTWLIGYSILGLSLLVLVPWVLSLLNARTPQFLTRQSLHWAVTGGLIVLLSSIAISVYGSFEWIAIRSSIHYGLYVTLVGGAVVLVAGFLNRSKGRRSHVHLAHMDRSAPIPDEEIERYLQRRETPVPEVSQPREKPVTEEVVRESRPDSAKREGPPSMFDL